MKYLSLLFFLLVPLMAFSQTDLTKSADQLFNTFERQCKSMGTSAAIAVNGKVKWKKAAGFSDHKNQRSFNTSTKTRIASIAKPMTAIAVMQLVEKGAIDLEGLIGTYLNNCPPAWKSITIRQLLAHTSGIKAYPIGREAATKKQYNSLEAAMNVFKNRPLKFKPGSNFHYSTYNYVVLGRIIELVSGLTYGDYMKKNIWEVAEMHNTGIENSENLKDQSLAYIQKNKRKSKKAKSINLSNRIPGGGLYSTVEDMIKFGQAVIDHKFITKETYERMAQKQFEREKGQPYGLGWFFYGPKGEEHLIVGHSGGQIGATTQLFIEPTNKIVVVVLSNTSGKRVWKEVVTLSSQLIRAAIKEK